MQRHSCVIIIIIKHSLYSAIPHKNVWAQRVCGRKRKREDTVLLTKEKVHAKTVLWTKENVPARTQSFSRRRKSPQGHSYVDEGEAQGHSPLDEGESPRKDSYVDEGESPCKDTVLLTKEQVPARTQLC